MKRLFPIYVMVLVVGGFIGGLTYEKELKALDPTVIIAVAAAAVLAYLYLATRKDE